MKIKTAVFWQHTATNNVNSIGQQTGKENAQDKNEKQMQAADNANEEWTEDARSLFAAVPGSAVPSSENKKIKASVPDDNVAQLASELANCQTKFDVQQVSGKAMRSLANLQMSAALSEGKDKEKTAQMIRRMKNLIKRVRTKMKNLTKEEEMEARRKRAEERKKEQEAQALKNELRSRRNKRHRDERDYAMKEAARTGQEAVGNSGMSAMDKGTPSLPSGAGISVPAAAGGAVSVDAGAALAAESVSLDVTV